MDIVCRCCLASDATHDVAHNAAYHQFYQQITNVPFQDDSGKPTSLCYECLYQFRKCMQLRDKCLIADRILNELIVNGMGISRESILNINRDGHLLPAKFTHQPTSKTSTTQIEHDPNRVIKIKDDNDEVLENITDDRVAIGCDDQFMDTVKIKFEEDFVNIIDNGENAIKDTTRCMETATQAVSELYRTALKPGICEVVITEANSPATCQTERTKENVLKCYSCNYTTTLKGNLNKHMVRKHTGEKPYKCDSCDYKCSLKHDFERHLKSHNNRDKPYKCELCQYHYLSRQELIRHVRTHTGEKPYCCDLCGHRCAQKGNLVKHIRKHTGEKPYKCDICHFKSAQKGSLDKHVLIHTGEKPYKCDLCDYRCNDRCNLSKHLKRHNKKNYKYNNTHWRETLQM